MHGEEGDIHIVSGEYREIRPPEKLVFTWVWAQGNLRGVETVVTLTLAAKNGGTELTLEHTGLPTAEARQSHAKGWSGCYDSLADALAGRPKNPQPAPVLLGDPRSSYTRSARMAFVEKGIAYRLEEHGPHDDAIAAVHPFKRVPALRFGPHALYETSAIIRYVDEAFAGPALAPDTPLERAYMEQWISAINAYMYDAMVRRYVLQYVIPRGADGKPDRKVIETALPEIKHQLDVIEKAYDGRDFLVGTQLSLADILLAPIVFYLQIFPESKALIEAHPNVAKAHAVIAQRESFTATLPARP